MSISLDYMPNMTQLPCSFSDKDKKWLKAIARKEETSTAEIVRRAVRAYRKQLEDESA